MIDKINKNWKKKFLKFKCSRKFNYSKNWKVFGLNWEVFVVRVFRKSFHNNIDWFENSEKVSLNWRKVPGASIHKNHSKQKLTQILIKAEHGKNIIMTVALTCLVSTNPISSHKRICGKLKGGV
jgi:hypothetical protein